VCNCCSPTGSPTFRVRNHGGFLLGGLYTYLYVTLMAEDYALLIGAVGAFAVLAAFMYLTRNVDWYAVSFGGSGDEETRLPPRG